MELLHATNARLIQRFKYVHSCKQECSTATCRVENTDVLQSLVEMQHKGMVVGLVKKVFHKFTDVEIVGDKVVDVAYLPTSYLAKYALASLQSLYSLSPYLSGKGKGIRSFRVPSLTTFEQIWSRCVYADCNIVWYLISPIR